MHRSTRTALAGLAAGAFFAPAWGQGIFTCVDAKGRKLTSDRPIMECLDREQKELNASGTVRRNVGPSLTAVERDAKDQRDRQAAADRQRDAEERRDLVNKYPNRAAHDAARATALQPSVEGAEAAAKRLDELATRKKDLAHEVAFYKANPSRMPPVLRQQVLETDRLETQQKQLLARHTEERQRTNARFEEELTRLKTIWINPGPGAPPAPNTAARKP